MNYYLLFWNVELELVKIFLIFSGGDGKKRKKQNKTKNLVPWNSLAQQLKKEAKKQPGNYFLSFYFKLLVVVVVVASYHLSSQGLVDPLQTGGQEIWLLPMVFSIKM